MLYFGFRWKTITHWCCQTVQHKIQIQLPVLCTVLPVRELGRHEDLRGQNQDSWPKHVKGIFCTTWHRVKAIILAGVGWRRKPLLRDWLSIFLQLVNNCIVHYLFCKYKYLYYYHYYFFLSLYLVSSVLSHPTIINFFFFFFFPLCSSLPHPTGREEWVKGSVMLSCLLGKTATQRIRIFYFFY